MVHILSPLSAFHLMFTECMLWKSRKSPSGKLAFNSLFLFPQDLNKDAHDCATHAAIQRTSLRLQREHNVGTAAEDNKNNVDPVIEKSQELNVTVNVNQSDQLEYDDVDEGKLIEVIREFWGRAIPRFPRMTLTHAIIRLKPSNSL